MKIEELWQIHPSFDTSSPMIESFPNLSKVATDDWFAKNGISCYTPGYSYSESIVREILMSYGVNSFRKQIQTRQENILHACRMALTFHICNAKLVN